MFKFGLYKEGLRKIRVPALILLFIILALSLLCAFILKSLIPISDYTDGVNTVSRYKYGSGFAVLPAYVMLIGAPILAFSLFKFLFRRNECDAYFAICEKRSTVFFSFILALFTWIAGILVLTFCFDIAIRSILYNNLDILPMLREMPVAVAWTVAYAGWTVLACNIANTKGTALILLATFFMLSVAIPVSFYMALTYFPGISFEDPLVEFFNYNCRMPTVLFGKIDGSIADSEMRITTRNAIISAVISIIAIAVSGVIFCQKRNEYAGNPTAGSIAPHFIRTALTMVPMSLVCYFLTAQFTSIWDINPYLYFDVSIISAFTVTALVLWFVYELIVTKSVKAMLKSAKHLWIPLILSIVFIGTAFTVGTIPAVTQPDIDDIQSITLDVTSGQGISVTFLNRFKLKDFCNELIFDNKSDIEYICSELETELNGRNREYLGSDYKYEFTITLKNGIKLYRGLYCFDLDQTDAAKKFIVGTLLNPDNYETIRITPFILSDGMAVYNTGFTESELREINEVFIRECSSMSADELIDNYNTSLSFGTFLSPYDNTDYGYFIASLPITASKYSTYSSYDDDVKFVLSENNFPKTFEKAYEILKSKPGAIPEN